MSSLQIPAVDIAPKEEADSLTQQEQALWDEEERAADLKHSEDLHQEELEDRRKDRSERLKYAQRIFLLIVWWIVGVGVIVTLQGLGAREKWFILSDAVLVALVSGTTINVLGIFAIVVNYLFRKAPNNIQSTKEGTVIKRPVPKRIAKH